MTTAFAGTLLALIAFTATVALIAAVAYIGYLRNKMSAQLWALDYMQEVYDLQTQESLKTCDDLEAAYDRIVELSKVWHGTPSEEYDKLVTWRDELDTDYGELASCLANEMHRNDQLERELSQLRG